MATNLPPMVASILALRSSLPPVTDELRKRVQSIRVRSLPDIRTPKPGVQQPDRNSWRNKQPSPVSPLASKQFSPSSPFRLMTPLLKILQNHQLFKEHHHFLILILLLPALLLAMLVNSIMVPSLVMIRLFILLS